jgi:predicted RNA polymerase sigma factor
VPLNRAVALAIAEGSSAGLTLVDQIAAGGKLDGYHLLPAVRGDVLAHLATRPNLCRVRASLHTDREHHLASIRGRTCLLILI